MVNKIEADDEGRKIDPIGNLRPRDPQPSTYGPTDKATAWDPKSYDELYRPRVPGHDYQMEQMSKMMNEVSARHAEASKPENIIARLRKEITQLREKIVKQQEKVYALQRSEEPLQNVQLEITMREGKIAKYKLGIVDRENKIALVEEKGELPQEPFVYKSKFRDLTKEHSIELHNVLK